MDRVEIYYNKKQLILVLIGCVLFLILGVFCILIAENIFDITIKNPIFLWFVALLGISFAGYGTYDSIKKLSENKLMLVIDEKGINIDPLLNNYIKWKDIDSLLMKRHGGVYIVVFILNNHEEYINKETDKARKNQMIRNLKRHGSPFNVSPFELDISHSALTQLINEKLRKCKSDV